jgi:predicted 2-oxoglutarate/Fe(II)-dependent dioxygenase YbiX
MISKTFIQKQRLSGAERINRALLAGFLAHYEDDDVRRTHLFNDRYENIYLSIKQVPQLATVLEQATAHAVSISGHKNLRAGGWFNYMPPGAVTTAHRHDDDDEVLSAVYYVSVPENAGNLLLHQPGGDITITPEAGMFVFFAPDAVHEVTENKSTEARLSIGINIGPVHEDD